MRLLITNMLFQVDIRSCLNQISPIYYFYYSMEDFPIFITGFQTGDLHIQICASGIHHVNIISTSLGIMLPKGVTTGE